MGGGAIAKHDPVRCTRAEFLEQELREQLDLADAALADGQPAAAVAAKRLALEVRAELDKLRAFEEDSRTERSLLEETRAMRRRADASGSHVAALQLLKVERELVSEAEAKAAAEAREALAHMTEAEIVALVVENIRALPADLREQVREEAFAQVH